MAPRYDEAPELAPQYLPEVHHPPTAPEVAGYQQYQSPVTTTASPTPIHKQESFARHPTYTSAENTASSNYGYAHSGYGAGSTHPDASEAPTRHSSKKRLICGCSVLVFILSLIIAFLSAAVIGLAAGTGIQVSRANDAEAKLSSYTASPTTKTSSSTTSTSAARPTSTTSNFDSISRNCSTSSNSVSGTSYNASAFFEAPKFQVFCNKDSPNLKLMSLYVANFDDCMDACAAWTYFTPTQFPSSNSQNQTCVGVSFIPAWTDRAFSISGGAPGNCYLKPGPQNQTALTTPNIGTECHAAILI